MTAPANSLPLTPAVPVAAETVTYTYFAGTYEAFEFSDWIDESMSWKQTCYIGDWSMLFKMRVKGRDAQRFFSEIAVNSFAKHDIGQAKHVIFCEDLGKVVGEGILMRFAEHDYLFTSGPGVMWAHYRFQKGSYDAAAQVSTADQFILQVAGPTSLYLMEKVTGQSMRDIGFMRFAPRQIRGMPFVALRQGMSGEIGFELHGPMEHGKAVYDAILEAGREFGIRRLGGRVKMVNHAEACFPTPTVDYFPAFFTPSTRDFLENYVLKVAPNFMLRVKSRGSYANGDPLRLLRSPVELGWGRNVKFDHDFTGRAALEDEVARPRRVMRTLVWNGDDVVDVYGSLFRKGTLPTYMELPRGLLGTMECDRVEVGGQEVGGSTSRCYSVYFREMISLCVIDVAHAEPGTEVTVIWGDPGSDQRRIRAKVAPAPYKTDNRKVDLASLPSTWA